MSAKELKKIFEEKFPEREVVHAGHYKNGFLFVAPDKKLGEFNDDSNPIYFISGDGKTIVRRSPVEDLIGIGAALSPDNRIF